MRSCPGVHTGFGWNFGPRRREGERLLREEERLGMMPLQPDMGPSDLGPSDAAFAPQNQYPFYPYQYPGMVPSPQPGIAPPPPPSPSPPSPFIPPPPGIRNEILASEIARGFLPSPFPGQAPFPGQFPGQGTFDPYRREEGFSRRGW